MESESVVVCEDGKVGSESVGVVYGICTSVSIWSWRVIAYKSVEYRCKKWMFCIYMYIHATQRNTRESSCCSLHHCLPFLHLAIPPQALLRRLSRLRPQRQPAPVRRRIVRACDSICGVFHASQVPLQHRRPFPLLHRRELLVKECRP